MNKFSQFTYRHIGSNIEDQNSMLHEINCDSLDDFLNSTLPKNILIKDKLNIEVNSISKSAKEKIEKIGGKVILIK